jgi:TPR repeat protein
MEETLRLELLAKTKQALDDNDWSAVEHLWQPWVQQGDAEAEYQLAYHYLWWTPCEDDSTCDRMNDLLKDAAAKDHPDAIWFLAVHPRHPVETSSEFERLILRASQLGSANAQGQLGVMYATGDWSGPKDLVEAARWYRLAAEKGHAESQYNLGFMLLLGEGEPKNTEEGVMWLERAGELGEYSAFLLLVDCYESGYCDVPINAAKAALWRDRLEEYDRLHPTRRYLLEGAVDESFLDCLLDIDGVTAYSFTRENSQFSVCYKPALLTPAQLDEKIRATGLSVLPAD